MMVPVAAVAAPGAVVESVAITVTVAVELAGAALVMETIPVTASIAAHAGGVVPESKAKVGVPVWPVVLTVLIALAVPLAPLTGTVRAILRAMTTSNVIVPVSGVTLVESVAVTVTW